MSLRIGVLAAPFHPVRSAHLELCRSVLADGAADRILLVLCGGPDPSGIPQERLWEILLIACAGSKLLLPCRLPPEKERMDPARILHYLKKKYPGDHLFLLSPDGCDPASPLPPSVEEYCTCLGLYGFIPRMDHAAEWVADLNSALRPHRFAHSLSVAYTSRRLAIHYGIDPVRAETAGLLHDCAKCLSLKEMRDIALQYHLTEDPAFLESPALLHSLVGARVASLHYGIEDPEILEAIAFHNTGHAGMSRLAMCICLADFIEPNRESFPLLEEVRLLSDISLEKALLLSLRGVADHVRSKGQALHPRTADTIAWLECLPQVRDAAK